MTETPNAKTAARTVTVEITFPPSFTLAVDADAWAREYKNGESDAEVIADVLSHYSPEQIMEMLRGDYAIRTGLASVVDAE